LEAVKPRLADPARRGTPQRVLAFVLDRALRILHPFIPFVTEAVWEGLNATVPERSLPGLAEAPASGLLIAAAWPAPAPALLDEKAEQEFAARREIIEGVRKAKAESGQSAAYVEVYIPEPGDSKALMASTLVFYGALAGVIGYHVGEPLPVGRVYGSSYVASLGTTVYVPMPEEMIKRERARLAKEIEDKKRLLGSIEAKLGNKQFTDRAPAEVVDRERARAEEARAAMAALEKRLVELG
jgi:valyl-tRNA synthetase